ncbi:MAG: hypothetical protein KKB22_03480 [Candidatus Omnitrophica bacterium]|nr:hypothetical protein [Candidatus Omnitrophota bacterium]
MDKILFFLLFLTASFLGYWFLPHKSRSPFLLIASLFFAFSFSAGYSCLFLFNIVIIHYISNILKNKNDRGKVFYLRLSLLWLIGNLCFFKYNNLIFNFANLLLPIGISYVTFRLIHYIVEVYRGNIVNTSFIELAVYVLFFPTFLAGPVDRFPRFNSQSREIRKFEIAEFNYGLLRIIYGVIKKAVIADRLAGFIMPVLHAPQGYPRGIVILSVYGLAIQLYMDFSGYTDMAIGIARLFGYKIMENFDKPYFKKNIALFWRSWHISVYSWIRDYFFFPVFGCRASKAMIYLGTVVTMVVFHLWHKATLGFLFLGIYHGIGLLVWQLFQVVKRKYSFFKNVHSYRWPGLISWFITFSFVSFGCIFFNSNITSAFNIIKRIFM